jgi:hypothetical protein
MMRSTFLDLLGLPHSASEADIKKRYRELVLKLHPDVNPSPHAAEQFQLIQKAYEFLINEDKQLEMMYANYKSGNTKPASKSQTEASYEDRRAEMRERAKHYSREAQKEAEAIELNVFSQLTSKWPWIIVRTLAVCSVVFGLFIFSDMFIPKKSTPKQLKIKVHKELFQKSTLIFHDDSRIDVAENVYMASQKGDSLALEYSGLLHEFLGYRIIKPNGKEHVIDNEFNLFTLYPLFALIFMVPGILFYYQANEVKFYLLYFATCVAYPGLLLHYILREDKLDYVFSFFFS